MEPGEILALAEIVKGISEVVWNVALLKVHADAMVCLLWGFVFFATNFGGWAFFVVSLRQKKLEPHSDWEYGIVISFMTSIAAIIVSTGMFAASIARFVAPAYFAIQIIRGLT